MTDLKELTKKENINIVYLPLLKQKEGLWGMYTPGSPGKKPTIYLDLELEKPSLYRLARCILAEELGHHFTGVKSFFSVYPDYTLKRKMSADDEKALRWATNKLIPTNEICVLIEEGICECVDLADYFGVTAWFMYKKMNYIQYQVKAKRPEINQILKWDLISKIKISCIF